MRCSAGTFPPPCGYQIHTSRSRPFAGNGMGGKVRQFLVMSGIPALRCSASAGRGFSLPLVGRVRPKAGGGGDNASHASVSGPFSSTVSITCRNNSPPPVGFADTLPTRGRESPRAALLPLTAQALSPDNLTRTITTPYPPAGTVSQREGENRRLSQLSKAMIMYRRWPRRPLSLWGEDPGRGAEGRVAGSACFPDWRRTLPGDGKHALSGSAARSARPVRRSPAAPRRQARSPRRECARIPLPACVPHR